MKIVHICFTYLDNFSYQDNELPKSHALLGHDVTIISTLDYAGSLDFRENKIRNYRGPYFIDGCKIIRLPLTINTNYRIACYRGLFKTLEQETPYIIFLHELPYFLYLDIIKYKKKYPCKLVVDYHCDYYNSGRSILSRIVLHKIFYRIITKLVDKYVDLRYGITPDTIKFVSEMYGLAKDKINLLPLGGNIPKYAYHDSRKKICNELNIPLNTRIIVTAGKMDRKKNIHLLMKYIGKYAKEEAVLLLLGSIDNSYQTELVQYNSDNIFYLGWKSPEAIHEYFSGADMACFPGSQSALWQQAICCRLPLIVKYWSGVEYLNINNNVEYFKVDQELESLLSRYISSDRFMLAFRCKVNNSVIHYFSYEQIASRIINDVLSLHTCSTK